jgi:hypothetical protein
MGEALCRRDADAEAGERTRPGSDDDPAEGIEGHGLSVEQALDSRQELLPVPVPGGPRLLRDQAAIAVTKSDHGHGRRRIDREQNGEAHRTAAR